MVIDPLDDLLASCVLEIDVDIRRLAPLFGDKAFEQQRVAGRINSRDAEHIADSRIGRRAAALTENVLRTGIADNAVHGQEIRCVVHPPDQAEFMAERFRHVIRYAIRIDGTGALPGQRLQRLLR
ncbi:hypothetical protein Amal_03398 [Acetobacter malorum]|uniref:Uncharacterized protein n=1 Tax=Acetobacter malorum TaxID=178901 RepID=A0A177FTT5_9PROT|nr:hypothetical protein Amal_04093 [Acetobacter malorum]OAG75433.1 hypothetical protein Amal_03398 [Acetobacter malorum]